MTSSAIRSEVIYFVWVKLYCIVVNFLQKCTTYANANLISMKNLVQDHHSSWGTVLKLGWLI